MLKRLSRFNLKIAIFIHSKLEYMHLINTESPLIIVSVKFFSNFRKNFVDSSFTSRTIYLVSETNNYDRNSINNAPLILDSVHTLSGLISISFFREWKTFSIDSFDW